MRADNPGAIALYRGLGFREHARRTTWQAKSGQNINAEQAGILVLPRYDRDWLLQEGWLRYLYPESMSWYQPMPWNILRPGLWPALYRFFVEVDSRHWTAFSNGKLCGALTWQPHTNSSDSLWAAVPARGGEAALRSLLLHACRSLSWRPGLALDFPTGEYTEIIAAAGFRPYRTLLWMQAEKAQP